MGVDIGFALLVLLFGLSGARAGFLRQITHWTGLLCGTLAAPLAAARLTPLAAPALGLPALAVRIGLDSVLFCLIGALSAWLIDQVLSKAVAQDGRVDKHGGFILGVGKGAVILGALISGALFFEGALSRFFPPFAAAIQGSHAVAFVRAHGFFHHASLPAARRLDLLARAARDPKGTAQAELAAEPALRLLLADPKVKQALENDTFIKALESGDLSAIESDPRLAQLLKEPDKK